MDAPYPERQRVSRIRERFPKQVEAYLLEWEVNNNQVINRYDVLMPCLHKQNVLFADFLESEGPPTPSSKRRAFEAPLLVAEVVSDFKKSRKVDNRLLCTHYCKPGHSIDDCWMEYPDKKKSYHSKGRDPSQPAVSLNNVTAASLQAMLSKAVDNILSSTNKS